MNPNDIARLSYERKGFDWTSEVAPRGDVSALAIAQARTLLAGLPFGSRQRLAVLSERDVLRALGVVGEDGRLNNAGALLLGEGTGHDQVVYQYRRTLPASRSPSNGLASRYSSRSAV